MRNANGEIVATNDNWKMSPDRAEIASSGLAPKDDRESVVVLHAPTDDQYTAIVRGRGTSKGLALVEAYRTD